MTIPHGAIELTEIVFPEHANHYGTLFAGHGLQLMAKAAFLAGRRLAQRDVVMASVSGADFMAPIAVGQVLSLRAWVSRIGRSSLTVCVSGSAEALGSAPGEVLKGVFEMVAVDAAGRPVSIDRSHLKKASA